MKLPLEMCIFSHSLMTSDLEEWPFISFLYENMWLYIFILTKLHYHSSFLAEVMAVKWRI